MPSFLYGELSTEAKNILDSYAHSNLSKNIISDCWTKLLASLYTYVEPYTPCHVDEKIRKIFINYIFDLEEVFSESEIDTLLNEYAHVVEYCCDAYGKDIITEQFAHSSEPKELSLFISELFDFENNLSNAFDVYLPFAGMGAMIAECQYANILSEEIDDKAWAISAIRNFQPYIDIYANASDPESLENKPNWDITIGDSFDTLTSKGKNFDYIIFTPPFGIKRQEGYTEYDAVKLAIQNRLCDGGTLCCILPASFLFSNSSQQRILRQYLLDNGYIKTVICLPQIFSPITNISTVLLIIEKKHNDRIMLVDGTSFISQGLKENGGNRLDEMGLLETIKNSMSDFVIYKTIDEVRSDLPCINPIFALSKSVFTSKGKSLYKLKDIAHFTYSSKICTNLSEIEMYTLKGLSDSLYNCNTSLIKLESKIHNVVKVDLVHCVNTPTLVVHFNSSSAKIGKIVEQGRFFVKGTKNEFFLNAMEKYVLPDYLLLALQSEFVLRQVRAIFFCISTPHILQKDLENIYIPVPSIDEQNQELRQHFSHNAILLENELNKSFIEYKHDIHMKKHAIGQTIFNLSNWIKVLQRARRDGNGIVNDNSIIGNIHKVKVTDIYDNIQSSLHKLQVQISKFDSGWGLQKETIALVDFIENYIDKNQSPLFRFIFDAKSHRANQDLFDDAGELILREGDPLEYIDFPKEALITIFDNIVSNACSHGFSNTETQKYIIKIDISSENDEYIITISNNGMPIASELSSEDVFTYGKTSKEYCSKERQHYGIGGYEVRKLMREYNGEVNILSYPNKEFPVAYNLIFYSTNILLSY